jgi:hypothetical protein
MGLFAGLMGRRCARRFLVEVRYREPSYETRHGRRALPYRFRYSIEALDERAAEQLAVAEFHRITALSSVGWTREIVEIDVVPAIASAAAL